MVSLVLPILGTLLLALIWCDAFITVFSTNGAGFASGWWTRRLWQVLIFIHGRIPMHRVLSFAGPSFLFLTIVFWYYLHSVAWTLIFLSQPSSVVDNVSGVPAEPLQVFYFVNTTVATLGYGDFVARETPWTVLATLSCFSATVIVTVSLSYVLAVLGAAVSKKVFAQGVFSLGDERQDLVRALNLGHPTGSLKNYVFALTRDLDAHCHKHLAYPVLQFFHSPRPDNSASRAVLLLADAFFLLQHVDDPDQRPPEGLHRLVRASVENFLRLTDPNLPVSLDSKGREAELVRAALQLPIEDSPRFRAALKEYAPTRQELLRHCVQDGWDLDDPAGAAGGASPWVHGAADNM